MNVNKEELLDKVQNEPIKNISDAVNIGFLATRSYGSNKILSDKILDFVQNYLAHVPLEVKDAKINKVESVTLISNIANEGPNLNLFITYCVLALLIKKIKKVNVIITAELIPRNKAGDFKDLTKYFDGKITSQLLSITQNSCNVEELKEKITFRVSPVEAEFSDLVGDVLIRYEGNAKKNKTYMYSNSLYSTRPTVVVTSSSLITHDYRSNLVLTVDKGQHVLANQFIPPVIGNSFFEKSIKNSNTLNGKNIITIYSGNRIKKALSNLSSNEWLIIEKFLLDNPETQWELIGASDVEDALTNIPNTLNDACKSRINVYGFVSLDDLMKNASLFLSLPRTYGGAGGAAISVASFVPVITNEDRKSDICNILDSSFFTKDFTGSIDMADQILNDSVYRLHVVASQYKKLIEHHDFYSKAEEMYTNIENAVRLFNMNNNGI